MILSLVKVLVFLAIVLGLALGAGFLMESEGGMTIAVGTTELPPLNALQSVLLIIAFAIVVWLVIKLLGLLIATLRFINGDETAISRYFFRNRERRGFNALSDGMLALASGDGKTAMSKAAKADKLLERPELTNLLSAQAAEVAGDRPKAEAAYKKLLQDDKTRFVGVQGLLKQKLSDGDTGTALKLAEKAFSLQPKHVETQDTLLKLQSKEEDWTGARRTMGAKLKHGILPRDVHKRRDAVLALAEAREKRADGKIEEAQALAIEANRLSPALVPAATMAAKAHMEQDKPRYATRVLKAAWEDQPHPELAAAFAAIEPEETPEDRQKRFKVLLKSNPGHAETKMLNAELALANKDYSAARSAVEDLVVTDPSVRVLTLMAAIEKGEGAEDQVVRGWLTKALSAPRDPQWVCDNCGEVHVHWEPVCLNCDAMDSLSWKRPAGAEVIAPGSATMLPLLEDDDAPTPLAEDPAEDAILLDAPSEEVKS